MARLTITKADDRDRDELAALQCRSMRTLAAGRYSPSQIEAFLAVAEPDLENLLALGTVWLARSDGQLVASAAWHWEGVLPTLGRPAPANRSLAVFRTVYVRPGSSRQGLGSMLMSRAENDARGHGATRARLHAMLSAVEFYKSRGYATVGSTVFDLGGIAFPGVEMTRDLIEPAAVTA